MINNLIKKIVLVILISINSCDVLNDLSSEFRGCKYTTNELLFCVEPLQSMLQNQTPSKREIGGCLIQIYYQEKCKKRLRENSIP
jgi:hypothetical protein